MKWENVVPLIHSLINYRGIPLYLVEKNVIVNKRQMHTIIFKESGVFVIEIRMSYNISAYP
jgi:hypothetical protein